MSLSSAQRTMLTGAFFIDGWHNTRFLGEANDLVSRGLLTVRDGSDDQRTVYHFEPVAQAIIDHLILYQVVSRDRHQPSDCGPGAVAPATFKQVNSDG
jgi:hypothetical protein